MRSEARLDPSLEPNKPEMKEAPTEAALRFCLIVTNADECDLQLQTRRLLCKTST